MGLVKPVRPWVVRVADGAAVAVVAKVVRVAKVVG